ncbi:MAG: GNAT family N-acetyltransferase [Actinomycetaceae bacterium]|nr:GNAT family N-acetyltransferase [Actinomycetaceae bacterium]
MAHVFVRPATGLDARIIGAIQAQAMKEQICRALETDLSNETHEKINADDFAHIWSETLATLPDRHGLLVSTHDGVITGFCAFAPSDKKDTFTLTSLHVDPSYTRQGHGSRLLAAAIENIKKYNGTTVEIWAFSTDDAHTSFLRSAGFAPNGVRQNIIVDNTTLTQHCWHTSIEEKEG